MKKIILLSIITILLSSYVMAEDESITFPDGSRYVGEFKDGKRHGQGTYTWYDPFNKDYENKYVGQWKDDKQSGQGTWTLTCVFTLKWKELHAKYVGQWKDGKKHGQGTYTWYDPFNKDYENKYVGQWENDQKHGQGTYISFTYKNEFENKNKFEKKYEYVGQWEYNQKSGDGTCFWPDGSKYVGQWEGDEMHGQGTMYTSSGTIYQKGTFRYGNFIDESDEKPIEEESVEEALED